MSEVTFLVRRDEKPKYFGRFDVGDIVAGIVTMVVPMPLITFLHMPLPIAVGITILPVFIFIQLFRKGRDAGFFSHWLGYTMRPKHWSYLPRHSDQLLGPRSLRMIAGRARMGKRPNSAAALTRFPVSE